MTACHEVSYSEWGNAVRRASRGTRLPLSGSFEITFRCNLRCVHCYIPDFSGRGELTTGEVKRVLDEIADAGCLWLLLTGGEILTRKDFPEIYLHAKRRGFLLTLYTNGTLLDARTADLLAEYPPLGTEITLYGLSDETYLRTTGFPGRFTAVRRAIDLLLERGLRLALKAVAMEPLSGEIHRMEEFCRSIGVPFRYDPIIHARLDGSLAPTKARPAPERVVGYDGDDPARMAEWRKYYERYVLEAPRTDLLLSCGAGLNSFHIDPKGVLLTCEALPLNGYDLRRGSFLEGWYGIVGELRDRRAAAGNVCAGCELRGMCDRCPATATLETGSPDGWIPYFCEITYRRAALLERANGNREKAERYLAHAREVAAGWTPPGAILPRAIGAGGSASPCGSGGCSSGACAAGAARPQTSRPIRTEIPGASPGPRRRETDHES
ncbi:MAG: radical SAM protein [Acidobacteriota bacterium]